MAYNPLFIFFSHNATDSSCILFKNSNPQFSDTFTFNCVFEILAGFVVGREYLLVSYGTDSGPNHDSIYITYNVNISNTITFKIYEYKATPSTYNVITIVNTLTYTNGGKYFIYFSIDLQPASDTCFHYFRTLGSTSVSGFTTGLDNLKNFGVDFGGIGCINGITANSTILNGTTVYNLENSCLNFIQIYDNHDSTISRIDAIYTLSFNANASASNLLFTPTGNQYFWHVSNAGGALAGSPLHLGIQIDARGKTPTTLTNSAHNPEQLCVSYTGGTTPTYGLLPVFAVNTSTITIQASCLDESTTILTPYGYKLISEIKIGDIIISAEGHKCKVINNIIHKTTKNYADLYIIPKDSISINWPPEDILLSSCHKFLYKDNIFMLPWDYASKNNLCRKYHEKELVTYHHLQLDDLTQDLVINGGFVVEGYLNYEPTEKYYIINDDKTFTKRYF
jgi:hypothetical protein